MKESCLATRTVSKAKTTTFAEVSEADSTYCYQQLFSPTGNALKITFLTLGDIYIYIYITHNIANLIYIIYIYKLQIKQSQIFLN